MEHQILERIGLTKNESQVYITLLKLGSAKAGQVLQTSGLNSGKIYEIFESLKNKGLISESVINNVRYFTGAPPKQLLDYLKKKKEQLTEDEKSINDLIPELEKLKQIKPNLSKAITYTGFKGIKTAVNEAFELMSHKDEILSMGLTEKKDKKINDFWILWTRKRILKKVHAREIFSERSEFFKNSKSSFTECRVLEAFTPVAVDIFGEDKVLIYNYGDPISCILIYDKNTAISFKHFFEQLWKQAKS